MRDVTTYNREYYAKNKGKERARKSELMRKYRKENPEKHRAQSRAAKLKLRERLLDMYGWSCALCGFSDTRAVTLDHVRQNGSVERRELGERGVYLRALEEFRPDEYRMLCMNCQFIERHKHDWSQRLTPSPSGAAA